MASVSGKDGSLDGSGVGIKSWSGTYTPEQLDATTMGSGGYREYLTGLIGMTGSLTTIEKLTVTSDGAAGTLLSSTGGDSFAGSIKLSSFAIEVPVDGIITYTYNFNFNGSITTSDVS